MVSEPDHFFSKNILPILKIFHVLKSSLALLSDLKVLNFEKSRIFDFDLSFRVFPPLEFSKTKSEIWFSWISAYQKTHFSEKIQENNARKQKWSGSLTISRQRYVSASRQRVKNTSPTEMRVMIAAAARIFSLKYL